MHQGERNFRSKLRKTTLYVLVQLSQHWEQIREKAFLWTCIHCWRSKTSTLPLLSVSANRIKRVLIQKFELHARQSSKEWEDHICLIQSNCTTPVSYNFCVLWSEMARRKLETHHKAGARTWEPRMSGFSCLSRLFGSFNLISHCSCPPWLCCSTRCQWRAENETNVVYCMVFSVRQNGWRKPQSRTLGISKDVSKQRRYAWFKMLWNICTHELFLNAASSSAV